MEPFCRGDVLWTRRFDKETCCTKTLCLFASRLLAIVNSLESLVP
jgi:hypothetical protein